MKNFGKLALLGAVAAFTATYAHATLVTYSTTGTFSAGSVTGNGTSSVSDMFGTMMNNVTLTFTGITGSAGQVDAPTFASGGYLSASVKGTGGSGSGNFTLGINQTVPGAGSGNFIGTLSGSFRVNSSTGIIDFTNLSLDLDNIDYTLQQPVGGYIIPQPGQQLSLQMDIVPTPEPSSLILLGSGLLSAGGMLMRRRRLIA